ncbi:CoA transferase [Microbacterium sp. BWT-B31]|uniref:CoA transferase n=1 Tax=Microbacterium sp. BWT-B31 TaxID=3232072 RepID=UPI003528AA9C
MSSDPHAGLALLSRLWGELERHPRELASIAAARHPVPLPARTDVAGLAWASVAAASLAAARAAGAASVELDPDRIAVAYASEKHGQVDGAAPTAFAPLSGFFRTADGWVRTHGNYPHHARALRCALGLAPDAGREAVADALGTRGAAEASEAIVAAGGICAPVAREDAVADRVLRTNPLVTITRLGPADAGRWSPDALDAPLRGIRVLDLTRVIAGSVCTRTLALLGADVLRIDPPAMPEPRWQHLDTGHGKRSALLDLDDAADRLRLDELLATADAVVLGYRPAGLARLGLSPASLAARKPGIVVAQLSAWGADWPARRGFDSVVQAASGISWIESADGQAPGVLPAQALDHSAGYLLATAVITLLERRRAEGGSWLAHTSLRRVAAELCGMPRTSEPAPAASVAAPARHLQTFRVAGARVTTAAPAVAYAGGPTVFASPRPWGQDAPAWL